MYRGGSRWRHTPDLVCAPPPPPPPKIGKNIIFWLKIVIFHTKYPKKICASLRDWKKYDFSHEIPQKNLLLPPRLEKI